MTTGKTIALTRWTFVGKVMSLLFNMLSRLVIAFLLRSKYLLISWLQSPSAVILEPKNIKPLTVSIVSDSLWPHGLYSLWNSPSQNTGVGSLYLLQGIFPTQGLNRSPALQTDSLPVDPQRKTNAEAEVPIFRPPDAKTLSQTFPLTGKDPDVGKDWGQKENGEDRGWNGWMASPTQWTWVLSKLPEIVKDREDWHAVHGAAKS